MEIKSEWYLRKPANIKTSEFAIRHSRVLPERQKIREGEKMPRIPS